MGARFITKGGKPWGRWCAVAKSGAVRMRELRNRRRMAGDREMLVVLPQDYKERFDRLRRQLDATVAETVCYLLDVVEDGEHYHEEVRAYNGRMQVIYKPIGGQAPNTGSPLLS